MSARLLWDELLRDVRQIVKDALKDYRPDLARSTGVVPGNRLPTGGNTGSGYTPTAHAATHQHGGDDALDLGALAGELTDDQHGSRGGGDLHAAATTSEAGFATLAANGGTTVGTVVQASDSRLSDARTPTAHASSHKHGGSDEVATATPGANAIPKAGSGGTLADGWLSSAIARLTDLTWSNISGKPSTFLPSAHASSHKHGGSDEVATATPAANAVPKAGSGGTLADGWLSSAIARVADITAHAAVKDGVHGLSNSGGYTLAIPATGTAALRASAATAGRLGFWSSAAELSHDANLSWDSTNRTLALLCESTVNPRGLSVQQSTSDTAGAVYIMRKSRGSAASPTVVQNGDYVGGFSGQAYNGSSFINDNALIAFKVDGAPSAGNVPLAIVFSAGVTTGYTNNLVIASNGAVGVGRVPGLSGVGDLDVNGDIRGASLRVGLNQVVGARKTGWALPTGTLSRATFDQSTVTLAQLAQRVAAIITDLYNQHGLIGA